MSITIATAASGSLGRVTIDNMRDIRTVTVEGATLWRITHTAYDRYGDPYTKNLYLDPHTIVGMWTDDGSPLPGDHLPAPRTTSSRSSGIDVKKNLTGSSDTVPVNNTTVVVDSPLARALRWIRGL